jgi:hypothetical protein
MVNTGDVTMARNNSGQVLDNNNFRTDVNLDGFINVGDTIAVRNRSGNTVSSPDNTAPIKAVKEAR